MADLILSLMKPENVDVVELLSPLLKEFEAKHRIHVDLRMITWGEGHEELLKTVLYGEGPHVSEVGTSWVSGFLGMNGIQPFTEREIQSIGNPENFLEVVWKTGSPPERNRMWAIPWVAGTRVLYYRRDLLEKAGIDEKTAFTDHFQFEKTLAQLKSSGIAAPWVVPTQETLNSLHYIASWIWDAGGDFINDELKQILFNTEESYTGFFDYFNLRQYLPESAEKLDDDLVEQIFWKDGEAAVTIGGHWLARGQKGIASPKVLDHLGVAPLPGVTFVGGSNLVIWEHTRNKADAVKLISFLTSPEVQTTYHQAVGLLPVRHDVLDQPPFSTDPIFQIAGEGIKTGRTFPTSSLWNVIERRLTTALGNIWHEWLTTPDGNLIDIISLNIDALARRLDIMLRSR